MSLEQFIVKQREILSIGGSQSEKAKTKGLVSSLPQTGQCQTAYLVYLKFHKEDVEQIADVSRAINRVLQDRSIIYGNTDIHQTIGDYDLRTIPLTEVKEDYPTELLQATKKTFEEFKRKNNSNVPWNAFGNYIYNQQFTILAPVLPGNPLVYELIEGLGREMTFTNPEKKQFRKARGEHITVSRITQDIPAEQTQEFIKFMNGRHYETVIQDGAWNPATSLNVGQLILAREGFKLKPIEEFKF